MKQSSSRNRTSFENQSYSGGKNLSSLRDDVVDDENDAEEMTLMSMAAILLQLKNQDLEYGLPYYWGRKRRRSAIDLTPPSTPLTLPPPEEPPRGAADESGGLEEESVSLAQQIKKEKKATSPSTPLSFSPSESDEKSTPIIIKRPTPSKIFTKKREEELLHEVSKLTETKDTLEREVQIVRKYCEEQRTLNLKLKAKRIKLSICDGKERASDMEMKNNNLSLAGGIQLAQPPQQVKIPSVSPSFQGQFHPLITVLRHHPTAVGGASCDELQSHIGLGMSFKQTRRGLHDRVPDLNLTSDEARDVDRFPPLDGVPRGAYFLSSDWYSSRAISAEAMAKAQAAEARKNRMQICKVKTKNSAAKSRQGHR